MYFQADLPVSAVRELITHARNNPVAPETVDAALYVAGSLNAYRAADGPFGSTPDDVAALDVGDLCDRIDRGCNSYGARGDGEPSESIAPILVPVVMALVQRLLSRWLKI